jgi:hypothetical protein
VAASEASERARADIELAHARLAGELALRRDKLARRRPMLAIAILALAFAGAFAWVGHVRANDADAAAHALVIARADADAARRDAASTRADLDRASRALQAMSDDLARLDRRLSSARDNAAELDRIDKETKRLRARHGQTTHDVDDARKPPPPRPKFEISAECLRDPLCKK